MKKVQGFAGIFRLLENFCFSPDTVALSLIPPGKERARGTGGSKQQSTFEKAKLQMEQIKALGIPQSILLN